MMRFVRDILIQSLVVIVVMYLVQIIKYWIVGEVRPSPLGVILSLVGGTTAKSCAARSSRRCARR